jgi:tRNA isopentenyl-2-thiomethyl-A-37 hydroxylase MiaE
LKPEQVLDDSALLQGLGVVVEAEHKAFMGYRAIAARYPSQPDVVRHMLALSRSDLQHCREMRGTYSMLGHHHSTR